MHTQFESVDGDVKSSGACHAVHTNALCTPTHCAGGLADVCSETWHMVLTCWACLLCLLWPPAIHPHGQCMLAHSPLCPLLCLQTHSMSASLSPGSHGLL